MGSAASVTRDPGVHKIRVALAKRTLPELETGYRGIGQPVWHAYTGFSLHFYDAPVGCPVGIWPVGGSYTNELELQVHKTVFFLLGAR
jgi:hypothetical protein